jgi:hypothetical protein
VISHSEISAAERCPRCAKPTRSFAELTTNLVEPKYGDYYVERAVRWCYPCAFDWRAMFWKMPVGKFDTRG